MTLKEMYALGRVPAEPIRSRVERYAVSRDVGVPAVLQYAHVGHHWLENDSLEFNTADRLICWLSGPMEWYQSDLVEHYQSVDLRGKGYSTPRERPKPIELSASERACAREGCSTLFTLKGKGNQRTGPTQRKFCSEKCQRAEKNRLRRKKKLHPREFIATCRNGHERTPENTEIKSGYRNCLDCERERETRLGWKERSGRRDLS